MSVADPNSLDYFRAGEPYVGLLGVVTDETVEYFRASEPLQPLVFPPVVVFSGDAVRTPLIRSRRTSW